MDKLEEVEVRSIGGMWAPQNRRESVMSLYKYLISSPVYVGL